MACARMLVKYLKDTVGSSDEQAADTSFAARTASGEPAGGQSGLGAGLSGIAVRRLDGMGFDHLLGGADPVFQRRHESQQRYGHGRPQSDSESYQARIASVQRRHRAVAVAARVVRAQVSEPVFFALRGAVPAQRA